MLLTMNKYSVKDAKDIQNSCFKLNSLQLRALLTGYLRANDEPHVPPVTQPECHNTHIGRSSRILWSCWSVSVVSSPPQELTEAVVAAAEASADELIRSEGLHVQLEESLDLGLPFLLPDGGFSCDTVRGIPSGFLEFLKPLCQKGERKQDSVNTDPFEKPRERTLR